MLKIKTQRIIKFTRNIRQPEGGRFKVLIDFQSTALRLTPSRSRHRSRSDKQNRREQAQSASLAQTDETVRPKR